jgi:predicted ATP-dependent endonuclease of OLD family
MKRTALLTLLILFGAGWSVPTKAQSTVPDNDRQSEKLAQKKQKALYKYQKSQEKAQQNAQRKADKKEQKAMKKYDKEQRKLLKNSSKPPAKQTP